MPLAPPAPSDDIAVIPPMMPRHTLVPSVSEGIPVEPPSPDELWGTSRPPSFYPQYRQEPIIPPSAPRSHLSAYPPPPVPPPVGDAPIAPGVFGSPAGEVIEPPSLSRPLEEIVIRPPTVFPPPIAAPSDPQFVPIDPSRTRQSLGTPRVPPIPITIESPSRGTPSPPFTPPGHTFGSPPGSTTHDRSRHSPSRRSPSRRSPSRRSPSRRSPIIMAGSPHSSSRDSPGRRSYRSSHSPHRQGRSIVVEVPPALPRSQRRGDSHYRSQSPPPPVIGPQLHQPTVVVQSESRGRSRHRVPPQSTALDRPHSHMHSRTPSPERYRPHPSRRDGSRGGSRRPHSPMIIPHPGSILPPVTAIPGQLPVVPIVPPAHPPVAFVQEPAPPRRLHRSHRHGSRTPSPVLVLPPGERPPRSRSWDRPRHRRNLLQRLGRGRRRSDERPSSRGHYDDYDAPDRDPRYDYPSRRHERSRSRLRRSSRSPVRSQSYSPEPRRGHRRRGSYQYTYRESLSPPHTSRRSRRTVITGPVPRSSRRRHGSHSPPLIISQGDHGRRSSQRATVILPGDDHRSPSRSPISIAPSHRLPRPPSIEFVPPSLYSERLHEWERPHPLVSALYPWYQARN